MSSNVQATRYLVLIYLEPGQREALRRYEQQALPVFRRHGGAFERIWAPSDPAAAREPETPDEIHVLRFESPDGLDAVRRDPEMQALVPLREAIVRKALLIRIEDVPLGRYFGVAD
ncbi:MAG TPA: DUF1330 domain-containing protein [Methylomirabilota bacterium]|jgi:uncharacterized protein (DUF1330 family)